MSLKLDLLGRSADEHTRRIPPDVFRQGAEVTSGGAHVLDDRAHIVLIVPNDGIQALGGVIEIFDKSVQLAVIVI